MSDSEKYRKGTANIYKTYSTGNRQSTLYANLYGATACGVQPKDTIKIKDSSGFSIKTPKREMLFCVQTPQAFRYNLKRCE